MAGTRKARVPMAEQIRLINECRQSGMTDADWCRENDIAVSTFYNWVSRCRKAAADQIPAANYGHLEVPRPKQDVVPIDIVPDHIPEQHTASQMQNPYLDNSHTIEVAMKNITVRISNDADPVLLARTFHLLQEFSCQVTSPDLRRSTLSAAIPICGNPLTDSVPLSRISLRWIRRPVLSSFSVEEDGTGSKLCSVNRTVSF